MKSLRSRLLRTLALVLLALFVAEWLLLAVAIRRVSEDGTLTHMAHDGDGILGALEWQPQGLPQVDPRRVEGVYLVPNSGSYYVMRVGALGQLRSPSLSQFDLPLAPPAQGDTSHYHADGPAGQSLIVRASRHQVDGRPVELFVAEEQSAIEREMWRLSLASLAVFLPLLAAALVLQGLAVRRALLPLMAVRDELRLVGAGRHARIGGDVPPEIKPLVNELNRLLLLLQRRLKQSRAAVGDLAHALKTPLAVLFRVAEDPGLAPAQREAVQAQANAIRRKLERELRRARLAGPAAPGEGACFQPAAELPELARALRAIHAPKVIELEVDGVNLLLPFDREDMLELVGNLADNACKWARARVSVVALAGVGGSLHLEVGDDGPGCTPAQAQAMQERGVRLDESKPGHGLGLAIVRDIVDLYEGTLDFDTHPVLGGLRVRVVLPAPPSATVGE
ncbi:MAG: hypothetical protein HY854_21760 [Burkholderiales bacterium]|nr:hypothetical protein [Burkholderiales bacterium]